MPSFRWASSRLSHRLPLSVIHDKHGPLKRYQEYPPPLAMSHLRRFILFLPTFFLLIGLIYIALSSNPHRYANHDSSPEFNRNLGTHFLFHSPSSLFSPSATISWTDDNSTFFAASPAAFGPLLTRRGLSGQLWIGSGFGQDNLRRRGIAAHGEGELGCSDIPGWSTGRLGSVTGLEASRTISDELVDQLHPGFGPGEVESRKVTCRQAALRPNDKAGSIELALLEDDGTDDHLYHPMSGTSICKHNEHKHGKGKSSISEHADIQSIQESAEIAGKVVLLSRGGCGFSEKVKWAQRRGASAVIVGDNLRGAPLVRMYAKGDASNITIPSLFTSHTTAHLLSSLIPPYKVEASSTLTPWRWSSRSRMNPTKSRTNKNLGSRKSLHDGSETATYTTYKVLPTAIIPSSAQDSLGSPSATHRRGWFRSSESVTELGVDQSNGNRRDSSKKLPSSKHLRRLSVDDLDEDEAWVLKHRYSTKESKPSQDAFVIGINDWRDPDVTPTVGKPAQNIGYSPQSSSSAKHAITSDSLKSSVITPGSGVYEKPANSMNPTFSAEGRWKTKLLDGVHSGNHVGSKRWFRQFGWSDDGAKYSEDVTAQSAAEIPEQRMRNSTQDIDDHDGLWVTLTPINMNESPVFNTLFVLVISPLFTLGFVYAMLLLRSRMRRRRWRAPKSVVERLPVHIYRVLSPRSSTAGITEPLPTTPLLTVSQPTDVPPRTRSRTLCGASASVGSSSYNYGSMESRSVEQEKEPNSLSAWRQRYRGKQIECVVCLEEYVDGVSKVMSLPCGHEFHVDCMLVH